MTTGHDLAIALRAAYLALHRRSEAAFAAHGVTADQFVLLATLARGGHALTQRELARRMPSDPSTVRAMLALLERRGLVERTTHPTDARARTVALTAEGLRAYRRLWAAGESIRARMLGALRPGEAETLARLLGQIAKALNLGCVPACRPDSSHSSGDEP
jgi:DNA-binding MarR family transcriptional regulator